MALNVPPIGTRGIYSLKAPFATVPNTLYVCAAIRYYKDILNQGVDVYRRYYQPYEIPETQYQKDLAAGVVLVSLTSDTENPIYVPSSYIASFPNQNNVNYHHVVLSLSLGALPEGMDLTFLKDQLAGVTSDVIGVAPTVYENISATTNTITPDEHDAITIAREAAIANRTTDYAKVLELQRQKVELEQRCQILEDILIENGLLD